MSTLAGRRHLHPHAQPHARVNQRYYRSNAPTFGAVRPAVLAAARLLFLPLVSAAPFGLWQRDRLHSFDGDDDDLPKSPNDPDLWIFLSIAVVLVLLGGVFAGLTIALMGQDETYLQVIASSGEDSQKKHAEKVLRLLRKGKHWVLVTLLLANVITNETLPIVLDRSLGGGWPAVVSSSALIVIFGEIAPQSVCVRYGLAIGAFCSRFVEALMWITGVISWPTAKLLDRILGEGHGTMYKKAGLKTLVKLHKTLGTGAGERLMDDEVTIINSVLDLKEKAVGEIMTPMQDVFTMSADTVLDERMMDTILSQGYSRIPIHAPDNHRDFIGMLLVKILITYDPEDAKPVRDFALATLPETAQHTSCLDIINFFQEGKSHMVLVSEFPGTDTGALGVVTLEDVIEELIGEEIIDESDVFVDIHKAIRRAPKSRYPTKMLSEQVMSDAEDEIAESNEHEPLLKNAGGGAGRPSEHVSSQTTFLMRRKSSAASDRRGDTNAAKAVPVRGNTADLREHLKHIAPSNAASNPRSTKYTSVKIKPGVGTIPENKVTTLGTNGAAERTHSDQSVLSEAVSPKRTKNASDGVAAVYGTMGPPAPSIRSLSRDRMTASEASKLASQYTTSAHIDKQWRESANGGKTAPSNEDAEPMQRPDKMVVGETGENDEDTVGELAASSMSAERSKARLTARSGSITETTVHSGGVKKIVLEATTPPSEEDSDSPDTTSTKSTTLWESWTGQGNEQEADADEDERQANGNGEGNGNGAGKKRKKKRGKKKKGGD